MMLLIASNQSECHCHNSMHAGLTGSAASSPILAFHNPCAHLAQTLWQPKQPRPLRPASNTSRVHPSPTAYVSTVPHNLQAVASATSASGSLLATCHTKQNNKGPTRWQPARLQGTVHLRMPVPCLSPVPGPAKTQKVPQSVDAPTSHLCVCDCDGGHHTASQPLQFGQAHGRVSQQEEAICSDLLV